MRYLDMVYTVFVTLFATGYVFYGLWFIGKIIRFFHAVRHHSANLITDKLYAFAMVLVAVIYVFVAVDAFGSFYSHYFIDQDIQLSLYVFITPFMCLLLDKATRDGLFAHNNKVLIGYNNLIVPLSSVAVKKDITNGFKGTRAIVSIPDLIKGKEKDITIQANQAKFDLLHNHILHTNQHP